MHTHHILEQVLTYDSEFQSRMGSNLRAVGLEDIPQFVKVVNSAVQFDGGEADNIIKLAHDEWIQGKPPFPNTIVEFKCDEGFWWVLWSQCGPQLFRVMMFAKGKRMSDLWIPWPVQHASWEEGGLKAGVATWAKAYENKLFGDRSPNFGISPPEALLKICVLFFSIMACANVERRLQKADVAHNARRARRNRLPIFDYWTLHINLGRKQAGSTPYQGGTHASPRVHLRRGHIRRLPSGVNIWVQACVVAWRPDGPGGILKDYRVEVSS